MRDPSTRSARTHFGLGLALALSSVVAACGGEGQAAADTGGTTRALLDARGQAGAGGGVPGAQAERPIDVALLGFDRGPEDAPIRVVEMSDYGCGYCRKFHQETWPTLLDRFVEEGKVHWKFLPFVTGMFANSPVATEAAECTLEQSPELFEAMHERLWDDQSAWKNAADPHAVVRGFAQDAGADVDTWDACMASDRRTERVMAATALARQLGVRGTPTFFVVGYPPLQGALPTETFEMVLQAAYDDAMERMGG